MKLSDLRKGLAIDPDDLDRCLIEQPDLFYHVAEAAVNAAALRDEAKLDLDETIAELDMQLRKKALQDEEKVTEEGFKQRLRASPKVKELNRAYIDRRADADTWVALKEAFQQRSYMLRELVAKQLAEMASLGIERRARGQVADTVRRVTGQMRRESRQR